MIILSNDDAKKMVERDEALAICDEYSRVTGVELDLVSATERPDFVCNRGGQRCGLELVYAMRDPNSSHWDRQLGGDGAFDPLEAALLVQAQAYKKNQKRAEPDWRYADDTMLVIQLVGCDGSALLDFLDYELMDEMSQTGFSEIWIADYSPMEPYGTLQLIGVKPIQWRGLHQHRFWGMKPYG